MVFSPHAGITASLLHFIAVLQGRMEIRMPPKSSVIEHVINKNIIGSLFIPLGWSALWRFTDSKRRRYIHDLIFLFPKTEEIPLQVWNSAQSGGDVLSDVSPHALNTEKNKCYSEISIACQRWLAWSDLGLTWLKAKAFGGLSLLLVKRLENQTYTDAKFSLGSDVTQNQTEAFQTQRTCPKNPVYLILQNKPSSIALLLE